MQFYSLSLCVVNQNAKLQVRPYDWENEEMSTVKTIQPETTNMKQGPKSRSPHDKNNEKKVAA